MFGRKKKVVSPIVIKLPELKPLFPPEFREELMQSIRDRPPMPQTELMQRYLKSRGV